MNYMELLAKCMNLMNTEGDDAGLILVLPHEASGSRVRLCKTAGPYGIVLNVRAGDNKTAAMFQCKKVAAFINKIMQPYPCFICNETGATLPYVLNIKDEPPVVVFTCNNCPHLSTYIEENYPGTTVEINQSTSVSYYDD